MKTRKNLSFSGTFRLPAPKRTRRHSLFRLKGLDKVRKIVEPAGIGNVRYGQIGTQQLAAGTLNAVGIDIGKRRFISHLLEERAEVLRRHTGRRCHIIQRDRTVIRAADKGQHMLELLDIFFVS